MAKRGNHEGTIYKRADGRWYAQVTLPGGRRKGFYGKTRTDVQHKKQAALADLAKGLLLPDEKQTVAVYVKSWLETTTTIRAITKMRYAQDVRRVAEAFPTLPLTKLTAQHVKMLYADQLKHLSSTSVRHLHAVFHRALRDALKLGLGAQNVANLVDAPRRDHFEMTTLTEDQAHQLRVACRDDPLEALFVLALATGMRRGELLALRWQNVDFDQGVLSVRASIQMLSNASEHLVIAETKTANSRRQVALSPRVMEALKAHRARQQVERLKAGPEWIDRDLVFPGWHGNILAPKMPGKRLHRLLRETGLPDMRFHDLRHTAISLMVARGLNPKMVAERVGDDVATLLRVYAHVTPNMQKSAAEVMDIIIGGRGGSRGFSW